jgi:hypothetical protein
LLLAGNFGDGRINVLAKRGARYARQVTGQVRGTSTGKPFAEPGLWGLLPGTATTGGTDALWFTAGARPSATPTSSADISHGCAACSPTPNPSTGPETRNAVRSAKSGTRHRTGNSIGTARSSPRCDRRGRCPDRA